MATIKDIAGALGLSSATVSRALRNDETLSILPETRTKIFMEAERIGYKAKGKKETVEKKEMIITVVHKQQTFRNQIDSAYYFSIRTGIEDACAKNHITCTFATLEDENGYLPNTQGIIIVGNYLKEDFDRILLKCAGLPIVTVGIISYYPKIIDHVTHSNSESLQMALNYLFDNGHTKIGYLGVKETPGTSFFTSRKQKFIEILSSRDCFRPEWVLESEHGKDRVERGYITMKEWIAQGKELPTAIFCANDPIALGALNALHEADIDVPGQISIVAHDGSYPTQYSTPPLTTIDVHPFQMGMEALNVLLERISNGRTISKKVMFFPELIERASVRRISADGS